MAVPPKPTQRLVVDGIFGQKTRDALAYVLRVDKFSFGTELNKFSDPAKFGLQRWINNWARWRAIAVNGSVESLYRWQYILVTDGNIGQETTAKLGATMIYYMNGSTTVALEDEAVTPVGRSKTCFQALLNGIIFRERPMGPKFYYTNTTPTWYSGHRQWLNVPDEQIFPTQP